MALGSSMPRMRREGGPGWAGASLSLSQFSSSTRVGWGQGALQVGPSGF